MREHLRLLRSHHKVAMLCWGEVLWILANIFIAPFRNFQPRLCTVELVTWSVIADFPGVDVITEQWIIASPSGLTTPPPQDLPTAVMQASTITDDLRRCFLTARGRQTVTLVSKLTSLLYYLWVHTIQLARPVTWHNTMENANTGQQSVILFLCCN